MHLASIVGELSAVLGAAYESFLRTRIERRAGRCGKVHRRALLIAVDLVAEMIIVAAVDGQDTEARWVIAIAELDRERHETEADVLEHHGFVVPEHEWAAFLVWVRQVRVASQ